MQISEGGRCSGRTFRQLAALPDDSLFLVHSIEEARHCQRLLREMGRNPRSVKFATPANFHRFEGARAPHLGVDHAYWSKARGGRQEAYDFLSLCVF